MDNDNTTPDIQLDGAQIAAAIKAGARNAASDFKLIQAIHDSAGDLGAQCATDLSSGKSIDPPRTNRLEIKAVTADSFTLKGLAAVYGGVDTAGDYFDANTDFWLDKPGPVKPLMYHHGLDPAIKATVLGMATLSKDSEGLWFEAQVSLANRYAKQIKRLAELGVLGVSTQAIPSAVARKEMADGRAYVSTWPIVEVSALVAPAEPRTIGPLELKALLAEMPDLRAVPEVLAELKGWYLDAPKGSLEARIESAQRALRLYMNAAREYDRYAVLATFGDYVILCEYKGDGIRAFYRAPYTLADDGEMALGAIREIPGPFESTNITGFEGKAVAAVEPASTDARSAQEEAAKVIAELTLKALAG